MVKRRTDNINRQHNGQKKDRQHIGQKEDRQHNGQKEDRQHNGQKKDRQHKNGHDTYKKILSINIGR